MKKYRVYFNAEGKRLRNMAITIIYGHSEEDALLRYGIPKGIVESINEEFA